MSFYLGVIFMLLGIYAGFTTITCLLVYHVLRFLGYEILIYDLEDETLV